MHPTCRFRLSRMSLFYIALRLVRARRKLGHSVRPALSTGLVLGGGLLSIRRVQLFPKRPDADAEEAGGMRAVVVRHAERLGDERFFGSAQVEGRKRDRLIGGVRGGE